MEGTIKNELDHEDSRKFIKNKSEENEARIRIWVISNSLIWRGNELNTKIILWMFEIV